MLNDKQEARVIAIIDGVETGKLVNSLGLVSLNPLSKKVLIGAKKELARVAKVVDKALAIVAPAPKPNSGTVVTSGRGRPRKVAK